HVNGDAELVGVLLGKIGVTVNARLLTGSQMASFQPVLEVVQPGFRPLYLDDFSPQPRQHSRSPRASAVPGEVHDPYASEWSRTGTRRESGSSGRWRHVRPHSISEGRYEPPHSGSVAGARICSRRQLPSWCPALRRAVRRRLTDNIRGSTVAS